MINRRKVLGLLGAAPVVGKQAAAKIAEETVMANAGIDTSIGGALGNVLSNAEYDDDNYYPYGSEKHIKKRAKIIQWLMQNGIPDWKVKQLRHEARRVYSIEPSISALVSVSPVMKVEMQKERNFKHALHSFKEENGFIDNGFSEAAREWRTKWKWGL